MNHVKDFLQRNIIGAINLEQIIQVLITVIVGFVLVRILRVIINKSLGKNANKQTRMIISKMVNYIGFSIIFMFSLSELGIKLSTLLGAAGILGIAIGIASQKSLGNIVSGIFMISEKSFEIGDVIKVGDKTGVVYSIDLLSIMLKTFDNLLVRIPNETLISSDVINITRFPARRMDINILISYEQDLAHVMQCLREVANDNIHCLDEPEPLVLIKEFAESGILVLLGIWFEKTNFIETKNSMILAVIERFRSEGIAIPYRHIQLVSQNIPEL